MCGIFLDPPYASPRGHSFAALATFHVSARYWKRSSLFKDIFRRCGDEFSALRVYFLVARNFLHAAYRPLFYLSNIVYFMHAVYTRSNDIRHSRSRFLRYRMAAFHLSTVTAWTLERRGCGSRSIKHNVGVCIGSDLILEMGGCGGRARGLETGSSISCAHSIFRYTLPQK
ncbi:hypothetical protein ALC62_02035 [Cyphomyrmex costatus]|uniref:Uncharacterized protein n=1 Tax=Cyphomyrmex costatus TaxID=456900 RepID=A0A151INF4_9HYME|nr:hypothetical protein ALC62_02035 [Cyphomyrmex costatus]